MPAPAANWARTWVALSGMLGNRSCRDCAQRLFMETLEKGCANPAVAATVTLALLDRNLVSIKAEDAYGRKPLHLASVWAGRQVLRRLLKQRYLS